MIKEFSRNDHELHQSNILIELIFLSQWSESDMINFVNAFIQNTCFTEHASFYGMANYNIHDADS